jgi:hypothetical protein
MDAINIGLIAEKRLSVHHAVLYLIALLFCTYFRITLLVIYPLLVVFLFYLFSWKLDRNALYLLGFTFLFWLLSFRDGIHLKYNLVSLYFYIPFILLLCAAPSKINPERNFLKMLMYPLTFVAIINNFFGLAQYIRMPSDDSLKVYMEHLPFRRTDFRSSMPFCSFIICACTRKIKKPFSWFMLFFLSSVP